MTLAEASPIADQKRELREAALARRDLMPPDDRVRAAREIAASPFPVALAKAGARLALPKVMGRGKPLSLRAWSFGEPLVSGVWGIREPGPEAPEVAPDILLVPFTAFDRAGYRIGYGAGYYDMTLAALRAKKTIVAVGLGFAVQETKKVPVEAHDQRLDFILTEAGLVFAAERV